ncbi:hypothetical protein [Couchioplanes caeruleus]|uniref:Uncharacterized protein n=2 Tax=Couchioplanes caeruleus TaxID=56438 RepID=A0A1K0GPZ6_9ACTN|nr:hypothetical protein [Couchioplanes caeruleus]OJF14478.1 hypothetical protein BG844_09570 [Couchioplanes caeruleus subsp. caeruleus]ROP21261.1 hypothetical protein EDD30_7657 [Couchioplanes caeruleus]
MAKGTKAAIRAVQQKGIKGLAWVSFGIAVVGGTLCPEMFIGRFIQGFLHLWPWEWIPPVLLAGMVVAVFVDVFIDLVPNQWAIWSALTTPTLAASVEAKLGDTVSGWCRSLLDLIDGWLAEWITDSGTGLAIGCIAAALIMARRVVKKSKAGGVA